MQAGHQKTDQIRQAINAEDYKRAVKLASKLEKNDLARAMQAYSLERLGRRDEALALLDSIPRTDGMVLMWINHTYALARKYPELAQMHLKTLETTALQPADRYCKMGIQAFEAVLKTYDFVEAQTLVLKIAKANSTNSLDPVQIWLWAATLGFLKAPVGCAADDPALVMAEAFFGKATSAAKTAPLRTMGLPLKRWLLIRRGKAEEALSSLAFLTDESPSSRSWTRSLLLRLCGGTEKEEEEFNLLLKMVENPEASDDFRAYARLARLSATSATREATLRTTIQSIIEKNDNLRGPLLGLVRLELEKMMAGSSTDGGAALSGAIVTYLEKKGHLACAFFDLQNDLSVFAPEVVAEESQQASKPGDMLPIKAHLCPYLIPAKEFVELDRQSRRWSMETMARFRVSPDVRKEFIAKVQSLNDTNTPRPSFHQVLRSVGVHESLSVVEMDNLYRVFSEQVALSNANGDIPTADDWVLLAAHVITESAYKCPEEDTRERFRRLLSAASLMQVQLEKSPDNFQLKLALNELFGHRLGAGKPAMEAFKLLRVKQVQLDAMGFLGLADLSSLGLFEEAQEYAKTVCEFSSRARGETAECFAEAFRFVENSSPVEIVRLENRLQDSYQAAAAIVERCTVSLLPAVAPVVQDQVQKKKKEAEEMEEKRPVGTSLFAKARVEVEDPVRGEAHVCLPEYRLVHVLKKLDVLPQLIVNSDLEVQACFDPPFGNALKREMEQVLPVSGPCARVPREASNSERFLKAWRARNEKWMRLRVLVVSVLINPDQAKVKEIEAIVSELGLLSGELTGDLFSLGIKGLNIQTNGNLDEADALVAKFNDLTARWSDVSSLQASFARDPRSVLSDVSGALSHGGFWIFAVTARLNNSYKKATKTKPFAMDSARFLTIREAATKAFSRIHQTLEALRKSVVEEDIGGVEVAVALQDEYQQTLKKVTKMVFESHRESLRRLVSVASTFGSLELYLS